MQFYFFLSVNFINNFVAVIPAIAAQIVAIHTGNTILVAIGTLRSSGIIDAIVNLLSPILNLINFPSEIMPLALLRPISGSASIAVATDIMKNYGVDSSIGLIASTIMGSTETTLYTIAVYSSSVRIKKTRFVLAAALIADFVGMIVSVTVIKIAIGSGFFWQ